MLKALRSLFRSYKEQTATRNLNSPSSLKQGDMFRFDDDFSLPIEIRGKTFTVDKVSTYFYQGPGVPEFSIRGDNGTRMFLSVEDFDGQAEIVISRKLKRKDIDSLLGWKEMKALTKDQNAESVTLSGNIDGWTATQYERRVFGASATYTDKDLRGFESPSRTEALKYFEFYSEDEKHSFEIEVWEGDEFEVCIGLVRPFTDITEYWPGA